MPSAGQLKSLQPFFQIVFNHFMYHTPSVKPKSDLQAQTTPAASSNEEEWKVSPVETFMFRRGCSRGCSGSSTSLRSCCLFSAQPSLCGLDQPPNWTGLQDRCQPGLRSGRMHVQSQEDHSQHEHVPASPLWWALQRTLCQINRHKAITVMSTSTNDSMIIHDSSFIYSLISKLSFNVYVSVNTNPAQPIDVTVDTCFMHIK